MDTLYRNGKLVFPLDEMLGYYAWSKSKKQCMVDISYYSYGWDELNVMKAYLILVPTLPLRVDYGTFLQENYQKHRKIESRA